MALNVSKLVALRGDKDWSQAEVARRAGLNQSYYCQLENGVKNPSDSTVAKLAEAHGVSPDELVA